MFMITIFLLLLVSVFATAAYFTEPSETDKRTRERLVGLDRRSSTEDRQDDIVRQVAFSSVPSVDRFLRNNKYAIRLQLMLDQAKLPWTVGRFFFFSAVLMLIGAAIGNWWIPADFFGWIPGIALGTIPLAWVMYRRAGRFRRFNLMLPDAIDLMSRALRAGHALPSALSMVADEISDPLGPEFRRTADELNYGLPFREALLNLERRFPVRDLRFLVTAILVQKESGGNLITLLDKSAAVLRSRIHLAQKVRVFTAQGRLTGVILMALPFVCFIALNLVSPGYTKPLFENEIGRRMVYGTILSLAIGLFLIRRIIRIKV
jgi:tight adherence protein B